MLRALVLYAGLGLVPPLVAGSTSGIVLTAADGVKVYARDFETRAPHAPVILLFHQAGSSKSEYQPIAPRLVQLGFAALAIDQRSGGDLYQPPNETVAHLGKSTGYDAALPDLEAALVWAKRTHPGVPVYVLGSSYSAALVFVLAAKHPHDVAAVMAFSPNEYLDNKQTVRTAAHQLRMPVFIDSAPDKDEVNAARMIYDVVPGTHKVQYVPANGVHGASTLREDRDPSGEQANWDALSAFLRMVRALPPA